MTPALKGSVKSASRRFVKDSPSSLLIEDRFEISEKTEQITWQLLTTAEVEIVQEGELLKQEGKQLLLENLSHPDLSVSVISLCPAPLELDKQLDGLKRLEIRVPAWTIESDTTHIKVRLTEN